MDQVISARLDPEVVREIARVAATLHTTRKAIIEQAIRDYAARVAPNMQPDAFEATSGAWARDESPETTIEAARTRSRAAFSRRRA
jgi:predicted transcriptional regulator